MLTKRIVILILKRMKTLVCKRCGHQWMPRKPEAPKLCPNPSCHSPRWNEVKKEG